MASSSGPAKSSSQPLHNFELPPQLRWNNREGKKSGGSHRRWRSMKPQPQPRPNSFSASPRRHDSFTPPPAPIRDFQHRHQAHLVRSRETDEEMKDEFERLSLLRDEALRHHRGRDWWSESGKSDLISYRRKKSGFSDSPARLGEERRSDDAAAAGGFDVYHRNSPYKKSSSFSGEVDARNTSRGSAFSFNSDPEENKSDAPFRRNPNFRKSGFSSPTKQKQQQQQQPFSHFSSSSSERRNCRMVVEDHLHHHESYSYPRYSNNYFRKSGFSSSPNKHPNFSFKDAAASYPRYPHFKKSGFSSPKKQALYISSSSYTEDRDDDAFPKNPYFKKSGFSSPKQAEERKSKVGEADSSYSKIPMKKSGCHHAAAAAAAYVSNSLEKNPKVAEADAASPEKKSAVASVETTTTKKKKKNIGSSSSSNTPKERKIEEKSKAAEADAENPKNHSEEKKDKAAAESDEIKDDSQKYKEEEENIPEKEMEIDEEEIKVWNLRPRNVKSKDKASKDKANTCAATGSKNKAQPTTKPAAGGKSGGGEKKEKKKKKLSVEVSLTKQEIEQDIYALTGGKPSRRPNKRHKNVQKQLDSVFPGLWLLSITPESYKVSENSLKG